MFKRDDSKHLIEQLWIKNCDDKQPSIPNMSVWKKYDNIELIVTIPFVWSMS